MNFFASYLTLWCFCLLDDFMMVFSSWMTLWCFFMFDNFMMFYAIQWLHDVFCFLDDILMLMFLGWHHDVFAFGRLHDVFASWITSWCSSLLNDIMMDFLSLSCHHDILSLGGFMKFLSLGWLHVSLASWMTSCFLSPVWLHDFFFVSWMTSWCFYFTNNIIKFLSLMKSSKKQKTS